jgi:hypothetical protein
MEVCDPLVYRVIVIERFLLEAIDALVTSALPNVVDNPNTERLPAKVAEVEIRVPWKTNVKPLPENVCVPVDAKVDPGIFVQVKFSVTPLPAVGVHTRP